MNKGAYAISIGLLLLALAQVGVDVIAVSMYLTPHTAPSSAPLHYGANGPTDKGIQNNFGGVPLNSPYNGLPAHAIIAGKMTPSDITGNEFASVFRGDGEADSGGRYNGTAQTAYGIYNANLSMRTQGQAIGFVSSVNNYGKGNGIFGNGGVNCYGGGEAHLPSSTPACEGDGEFEVDQGSLVWQATVTSPASSGATVIYYTPVADEGALGARAIFNYNHPHESGTISSYTSCQDSTAGACSVLGTLWGPAGTCPLGVGSACTVITLASSSLPTGTPDHWYYKSWGNNDNYSGACNWDDVTIHGHCFGHWYRVANIPDSTHLVLAGVFDNINLNANVGSGTYLMLEGVEATDVDTKNHTFTIPSNTLNWGLGEILYSPPSHYVGMVGVNLIFRKTYKTGETSAQSLGARIANFGPAQMDEGILISGAAPGVGGFRKGIKITNLSATTAYGDGSFGIDIDGSANAGVIVGGNDDSTHVAFLSGTSGQCQMGCGLGGTAVQLKGEMISVEQGVNPDGGGKKIASITDSSSLTGLTAVDETITWTTPFRGTGYVPICVVNDPSKKVQLISLSGQTNAHVIATVYNTDASGHANFTVQCFAEWSGN